jgi:peptide chain release factor 1
MFRRLDAMVERFSQVEAEMGRPEVAMDAGKLSELARERSALEPAVRLYADYKTKKQSLEEAQELIGGDEPDLAELAAEEIKELEPALAELEEKLRVELLPKDPYDAKDTVVEIRAGTGGAEAGLFVGDLFGMYTRFSEGQGWKTEVMEASEQDVGGYREIIFTVKGKMVYSRLKHESGVHRVQRVPQTETQGRIHTSTATVAVLPEADEVDVKIDDADVRVDLFCSSGPGGQSVNTTKSAVRLTHLPSGLVVSCQDEKSQHKNKAKAMKVLRSRLLALEMDKAASERSAERKGQIGSGDRSERIRTYNFPQSRVSDHRINLTLYNLPEVIGGKLDEVVDALQHAEQESKLAALAEAEAE